MKNKYIDAIFMGILLCILLSLSFLGPALVSKMSTTKTSPSDSPAFMEADEISAKKPSLDDFNAMSLQERNMLAREFHEKYPGLVDVMLDLRSKGFLTYDDVLRIHKSIENFESNKPTEVPYTDKDLLEYLYDNSIITKAQLEQILDLIDEDD